MKKYDALIIGFGKGGKTLAAALGKKGIKTAVIEKSPLMYGGTCINIGCIPTKKLIHTAADAKKNQQADYSEKNNFYAAAIREKNTLTALLRQKNYDNVAAAADIYTGAARFQTDHTVEVQLPDGKISLYGEKIFINTGSEPVIPPITGLQLSKRVYTSTTLMELSTCHKDWLSSAAAISVWNLPPCMLIMAPWSLFWNTAIPSSRVKTAILPMLSKHVWKSWAFALSLMHRSMK